MLIEKKYQGTIPTNKILNEKTESETDTYSCEYINGLGSGGSGITEIPIASETTLGGIKVGANLTIDEDGTLNASASGGGSSTEISQMFANATMEFQNNVFGTVNVWGTNKNINTGNFYCDPENSRIVIPAGSAEYIEIFGNVAGAGYTSIYLELRNEDNQWIDEIRVLLQFGGNKYFSTYLGSKIVKIPDTTKDYYIILLASGYREAFTLNLGFSNESTTIGVRKIK